VLAVIRCSASELGMACMRRCAEAGISCASGLRHPYKPDVGEGDLWQCRAALGIRSCWYYYEAVNEKCVFSNVRRPLCAYQGRVP